MRGNAHCTMYRRVRYLVCVCIFALSSQLDYLSFDAPRNHRNRFILKVASAANRICGHISSFLPYFTCPAPLAPPIPRSFMHTLFSIWLPLGVLTTICWPIIPLTFLFSHALQQTTRDCIPPFFLLLFHASTQHT